MTLPEALSSTASSKRVRGTSCCEASRSSRYSSVLCALRGPKNKKRVTRGSDE